MVGLMYTQTPHLLMYRSDMKVPLGMRVLVDGEDWEGWNFVLAT